MCLYRYVTVMMHFTVPGVQNQKCALRWGREKEKTLEKSQNKKKTRQALSHESQKYKI